MEGQERNMAQLERIGTTIEQKWGSEEESGKEESGDDVEGSEDGPGESQEGGLCRPPSVSILVLFFFFNGIFILYELNV